MVGNVGFEPTISCSQSRRLTRLGQSPRSSGGDGGNRTLKCALQRRQFPVSLRPQLTYKLFIRSIYIKEKRVVRPAGLEPALARLEVGGLIQLDDERITLFICSDYIKFRKEVKSFWVLLLTSYVWCPQEDSNS